MAADTFGKAITLARKAKGLSQKELASLIIKEDGQSITPQYLNDIEHDRRNPTSDHMVEQFARVLEQSADYLSWLVGKLPSDVRRSGVPADHIDRAFVAFRRELGNHAR